MRSGPVASSSNVMATASSSRHHPEYDRDGDAGYRMRMPSSLEVATRGTSGCELHAEPRQPGNRDLSHSLSRRAEPGILPPLSCPWLFHLTSRKILAVQREIDQTPSFRALLGGGTELHGDVRTPACRGADHGTGLLSGSVAAPEHPSDLRCGASPDHRSSWESSTVATGHLCACEMQPSPLDDRLDAAFVSAAGLGSGT